MKVATVALLLTLFAPPASALPRCADLLAVAGRLPRTIFAPPSVEQIALRGDFSVPWVEDTLATRRERYSNNVLGVGALVAFGGYFGVLMAREAFGVRGWLFDHYSNFTQTAYGVFVLVNICRVLAPQVPGWVRMPGGFAAGVAVNVILEKGDAQHQRVPLDVLDVMAGTLGASVATVHELLLDRWLRTQLYDEVGRINRE